MDPLKIMYVNTVQDSRLAELCRRGVKKGLLQADLDFELCSFDIFSGERLYSPRKMGRFARELGVDGVILSGSEKYTTDREDPWLQDYYLGLRDLLQLRENISLTEYVAPPFPILGISFAHHALASVFGGDTAHFSTSQGLRQVRPVGIACDHPLFRSWIKTIEKSQLKVLVNHSDQVLRLPEGFYSLFTSEDCQYQGMAHRQWPIVSMQGQLDYTLEQKHFKREDKSWKELPDEDYLQHLGHPILKQFITWAAKLSVIR